jgi:hypothetical protein
MIYIEQNVPNIQSDGLNTLKATTLGSTLAVTGASTFTGAITANGGITGQVTGTGAFTGSTETVTGSGAVGVTTLTTKLNTTGGGTLTLANGVDGQVKVIVLTVDSGTDAVITPTTKTGFTTITLGDAGDGVTLVYTTTTGWICTGNNGAALA